MAKVEFTNEELDALLFANHILSTLDGCTNKNCMRGTSMEYIIILSGLVDRLTKLIEGNHVA